MSWRKATSTGRGVKELVPDTTSYVRTAYEEIAPRIGDADIVLLNKCRMDEEILQQSPRT